MRHSWFLLLGAGIALAEWSEAPALAQDKAAPAAAEKKDDKAKPDAPKDGLIEGRTVKQWLDLLQGKDRKEAYRAAGVLAAAGTKAAEAGPELEKMQKDDPDPYKKSLASYVLAYLKPEALNKATPEQLLGIIKANGKTPSERSIAASQLARKGNGVTAFVVAEVLYILKPDNNKDPYVRALAAYVLPYLKPKSHVDVVKPLAEALNDPNREVARTAAGALVVLGDKARDATNTVLPLLDDKDSAYKRALGAYVLGNINPDRTVVAPALTRLLNDKNEKVRNAAQQSLEKLKIPIIAPPPSQPATGARKT